MRKTLLLIIAVFAVLLSACTNKNTEIHTNNNNTEIYFNESSDFVTSGARLVEPIPVTESEFTSHYNLDLSGLVSNSNQKILYRLDYDLYEDTVEADLTSLSNGVVTITENDVVIFVMYVSDIKPIVNYVVDNESIQTSRINNVETRLFELTRSGNSILYSEFKLGEYHITCSMYNKTQTDMISYIEALIETAPVS